MTPSYPTAAAALVLCAAAANAQLPQLPAVPPPVVSRPLPLPPPTPLDPAPVLPTPAVGGYVVLKGDRLVEGRVSRTADGVTVRRGAVETSYPRADVLFVGATRDDVYQFRRAGVDDGDAAGRLAVAKWCAFNGMREQALAEARAVAALDPSNAAAAGMARSLEESLRKFPPAGATAAPPVIPLSDSAKPADPTPDVAPEAFAAFRTRVQPILSNLCVGCHSRTDGGAFRLSRVEPVDPSPEATRRNLRAVIAQVRPDDAAASPLLVKALSAHGGMPRPAFADSQSPAFRTLAEWATAVAGPSPARPVVPPVPPPPSVMQPNLPVAPPAAGGLPALPPVEVDAPPLPTKPATAPAATPRPLPAVPPPPGLSARPAGERFGQDVKVPAPTGPSPTNPAAPVDEFDPSVFNRAARPAAP